ncbi:rhomboid family intramembrane serine protease [Texcoconibacillus texcoconensis]|uniref:Membrane associated rhomboid family serine protease n=1 Tax=Texcoconibacillus texcoconensis TaxID=1095777 RepID=A0A840QS98_9BACI|nr:rhomboid family intramembrane serine protease [Texcoconibacillus texcoconensis]MBB5174220.1 membrane associated rhomboid family serine protease [Texcoconibacillus texcoconensis]
MFIRNESFDSYIRSYPIVTGLIAINLILYVWVYFFPWLGGDFIRDMGIGFNFAVIMLDEYWRLVTSIFLHAGLTHALFNSFSLFLFGPALEQMLGKMRFIVAYLGTGILANIGTLIVGGIDYNPHLGASGAIFGLFGIYIYMVLFRKDLIDSANAQIIMTIVVIGLIMTFVNPRINIYGHLFGLIAGAAIGPMILYKIKSFNRFRRRPDPDEIAFDPNRWQKKEKQKQWLKRAGIALGIVLLIGWLGQLFL